MKRPTKPKFKELTYNSRKFLNKKIGVAAVETYISLDTFDSGVNASIDISDCNRKVSLDFYVYNYNKKIVKEKLDKLDLLINELTAFRTKLKEFITEGEKRREVYNAYNKDYRKWKKENPDEALARKFTLEDLHD